MIGTVRPAEDADFEAILRLYQEVDDLHLRLASDTFRQPEEPRRTREWLAGMVTNPDALLLVSEIDGVIVGLVEAIVGETKPLPILVHKRFVTVYNLAVSLEYRRRGEGRALMEAVREWAREQGAAEIRLTVYEANRQAAAFYEALGYTPSRRELRLPVEQ